MSRSKLEIKLDLLDDEIQFRIQEPGGDLMVSAWLGVEESKQMARKILGLVEEWERMGGGSHD